MTIALRHTAIYQEAPTTSPSEPIEGQKFELVSPPAHDPSQVCDPFDELTALDDEIARAELACQVMLDADQIMKRAADQELLRLGFSEQHISELRRRAGPGGGYPPYSIRNIRETLRALRSKKAVLEQANATRLGRLLRS